MSLVYIENVKRVFGKTLLCIQKNVENMYLKNVHNVFEKCQKCIKNIPCLC